MKDFRIYSGNKTLDHYVLVQNITTFAITPSL